MLSTAVLFRTLVPPGLFVPSENNMVILSPFPYPVFTPVPSKALILEIDIALVDFFTDKESWKDTLSESTRGGNSVKAPRLEDVAFPIFVNTPVLGLIVTKYPPSVALLNLEVPPYSVEPSKMRLTTPPDGG